MTHGERRDTLPGGGDFPQGIAEGAMAGRAAGTHARLGFKFSQDAAGELREILRNSDSAPGIVPQLEMLLHDHLSFLAAYHAPKSQLPIVCTRDIKRIEKSLAALIEHIDNAGRHTKAYLQQRGSLYDLAVGNSAWDELTTIRESALRARHRLSATHAPGRRPRGRPVKPERHSLAWDVALVLRANGIRVTSADGGKFNRVMSTVLTEAEGKAPVHLFRLLKPALDAMKELTALECRQLVQRLFAQNRVSMSR